MKDYLSNGKLALTSTETTTGSIETIQLCLDANHAPPRILLMDDDPTFGRLMIKFAERAELELTYCASIRELERISLKNINLAIVDYDLQNISGIQLVHTLSMRGTNIPTILVSAYKRPVQPPWEVNIIHFVSKSRGPLGVLSETLKAYRVWEEARQAGGLQ